jgi:hypothetical protein
MTDNCPTDSGPICDKPWSGISHEDRYMLAEALMDRIHSLINDSIPHGRSLKPVENGRDYWRRMRCVGWAYDTVELVERLGLEGLHPCAAGLRLLVDSARDFLQLQRNSYFALMRAESPVLAADCEEYLERMNTIGFVGQ